jgi:DNA ligase-3
MARDDKRVYHVKEKNMCKLLSTALPWDGRELLEDFEKYGDMSETARKYFEKADKPQPSKPILTLQQVNGFLDDFTKATKENEQLQVLQKVLNKCSSRELKWIWKLMDHDLKINIGPKYVLGALHPKAFDG